MEERPGPVHLELPEDVAGEETEPVPLGHRQLGAGLGGEG
jgi:thiamine pyrophosphate-dependent acetolactate synthase large subunit-like protein